jgi:hypothetical protein
MVSYPSIFFPRYIHMVTFVLKKWPPKARKRWFHGQPAAIKQRIARLSMRTASVFIPRKAKYASLRWRRNGRSRDFLETWTIHDAEQSETWAKPNTIPKVLVYNILIYIYITIILYIIIFYIPLYTIIIYHCIIYYTIIYIPLYIPLLHGWFMAAPQRDSRWPPRFWPRRWAWRSQKLVPSPVYHKESKKKKQRWYPLVN